MRLLYVPLRREAIERLAELAERERRSPRDQAAWLLERALRDLPEQRGDSAQREVSDAAQ